MRSIKSDEILLRDVHAVMIAGGYGQRLRPYTLVVPKPLMPLGDRTILEWQLKWLQISGIRQVFISIGHLGNLIKSVCGNCLDLEMRIDYITEGTPLGTAGPLSMIRDSLSETFLVANADLYCDVDIPALVRYHKQVDAALTIVTYCKTISIPYGVVDIDNELLTNFREKPKLEYWINAGIYCMSRKALELVPTFAEVGMDKLISALHAHNHRVAVYKHVGIWLDIGSPNDLINAQERFENNV